MHKSYVNEKKYSKSKIASTKKLIEVQKSSVTIILETIYAYSTVSKIVSVEICNNLLPVKLYFNSDGMNEHSLMTYELACRYHWDGKNTREKPDKIIEYFSNDLS